ncbi:MAG: MBL fold metallo-hydrolase [Bacteroidia bacterium]|nr:MBL fold metallo-hydrolase [Bacteroidia bacterium]MDW8345675.1 MBL fold metallo-hydrolase [Bacteroidia bacterium]
MFIALSEGTYTVGLDKKFVPFDKQKDRIEERKGTLLVHIQPFVVYAHHEWVLIDAGLGFLYGSEYHIHQNLASVGISYKDIQKVLLSHLHFDHANGVVSQQGQALFPNAEYFVQAGEYFNAISQNSKSYQKQHLELLYKTGQLHLLSEKEGHLSSHIRYEVSGGHTQYHQVFWIESDNAVYFYGGDVLPSGGQVNRKFVAKYDYDGKKAMHDRIKYAHQIATEELIALFYHSDSLEGAKLHAYRDNFEIEPVYGNTKTNCTKVDS